MKASVGGPWETGSAVPTGSDSGAETKASSRSFQPSHRALQPSHEKGRAAPQPVTIGSTGAEMRLSAVSAGLKGTFGWWFGIESKPLRSDSFKPC